MNIAIRRPLLVGVVLVLCFSTTPFSQAQPKPTVPAQNTATSQSAQTITWDDLMPKDWDPAAGLKAFDYSKLKDSDPRAIQALQRLREAWDQAPIEPRWHGKRIRIPGFVVTLDPAGEKVREFLLVPYFGACIHTPPPPANQVIHVTMAKPVSQVKLMDAVWVQGALQVARSNTGMGTAGYKMQGEQLTLYQEKPGSKP
ncbi:DUF3299 domain-containing protein [Parvibium lacunae]|uniref:DUF3299 domain-containing protein n=1 Tax=Parvibium lacunae TaxID=1888893 RepID=A0A368L6C0_9BURK|nr:DUF3299 domain-containing protein [Parvibium lacunae]RCS59205.1 DUF3299 domain-containing protein [Parvibium lacunae]